MRGLDNCGVGKQPDLLGTIQANVPSSAGCFSVGRQVARLGILAFTGRFVKTPSGAPIVSWAVCMINSRPSEGAPGR